MVVLLKRSLNSDLVSAAFGFALHAVLSETVTFKLWQIDVREGPAKPVGKTSPDLTKA